MQLLRASTGQPIRLSSHRTLGLGGEARIYAVAGSPRLAAKIYHRPTPEHAAKLAAMLANPPEDPEAGQGHVSIAWPLDLLITSQNSQHVVGFLMPLARGMPPVIDFYHPKTRRQRHPGFNYRYILRTARNLAACAAALHARGYVIGDLNESNILVSETALVTLVDTDSFQVPDPVHGRVYRCLVGKAEFTPPELHGLSFALADRRPEHDLFGLAALFFQLLMEGTHPFAGRHNGFGEPPSLEERIRAGGFPYAPREHGGGYPMVAAPRFNSLHPLLRQLFLCCFVEGHANPAARPEAHVWQRALELAENSLVACPANDQHRYDSHLSSCPWCERRRLLQGLDVFPSRQAVQQGLHLRSPRRSRLPPQRDRKRFGQPSAAPPALLTSGERALVVGIGGGLVFFLLFLAWCLWALNQH